MWARNFCSLEFTWFLSSVLQSLPTPRDKSTAQGQAQPAKARVCSGKTHFISCRAAREERGEKEQAKGNRAVIKGEGK